MVITKNSHVLGFRIGGSQIDVVRIIFQTSCPYFSILTRCIQAVVTVDNLIISAVRFSIGCTYTESFILISSGETETITISFSYVSAVIFTLILSSKVQTINQTKEVVVTISCNTSGATSHEHICLGPGIATEFWQNVSPRTDVVCYTVVTAVID